MTTKIISVFKSLISESYNYPIYMKHLYTQVVLAL